jgi:CRISPR-associated protein Csb1
MEKLNLTTLKGAVAGKYAAIRRVTRLEPLGDKIFPPTYEGGEYADEERQVRAEDGTVRTVATVLLDSVQSQANRLELALLHAYDSKRLKMPMLQVDFAGDGEESILAEVGRITALEAPHRMCDAIFWDSVHNGQPFRQSEIGLGLNGAKSGNATPVFGLCPTALLFGFWDSNKWQRAAGGKVQRALVSEIVGYQTVPGKRTASRIDPLQIEKNVELYAKQGGGWTLDKAEAITKDGKPRELDPSDVLHGNIPPSFRHEDKKTKKPVLNHGGVTLAYAEQQTVLSLAALRRLRFPLGTESNADVDQAARTVLAALGLAAICFLDEDGYDLRSRCLLDGKPGVMQFVGRGETFDFSLDAAGAAELVAQAAAEAVDKKLPWSEAPVTLQPSPNLSRLVVESRKRSMAAGAGE